MRVCKTGIYHFLSLKNLLFFFQRRKIELFSVSDLVYPFFDLFSFFSSGPLNNAFTLFLFLSRLKSCEMMIKKKLAYLFFPSLFIFSILGNLIYFVNFYIRLCCIAKIDYYYYYFYSTKIFKKNPQNTYTRIYKKCNLEN